MTQRYNTKELVFASKWKSSQIKKNDDISSNDVAWIFFENCSSFAKIITSFCQPTNVFFLGQGNCKDILSEVESKKISRLIFMIQTDWFSEINRGNIGNFLELIKHLTVQNSGKITFDIVTIKSIVCPVYGAPTHPVDGVFVGLNQTLARELDCTVRSFVLDKLNYSNISAVLYGEFFASIGLPIVISEENYWVPQMESTILDPSLLDMKTRFRYQGTYMIIGANGGLGGMLAKYLALKYNANLILIGRSENNLKLVSQLERLGANSVFYEKANIEKFTELNKVLSKYENINGIIHSAILLDDSLIANMSKDKLFKVLGPKVNGSINLIKSLTSLRYLQIDFVLFFSSIQSYIANPGQANYTAACVAKDALASMLSEIYLIDTKIINWGYWGNIGVVASDRYRERMEKLGIGSIEEAEGLLIIEEFLCSGLDQITVIKASPDALKRLEIKQNKTVDSSNNNVGKQLGDNMKDSYDLYSIVPSYDSSSLEIHEHELAIEALDKYTCRKINEVKIPENVYQRFLRLVDALSIIPSKTSLEAKELVERFPQISGHVNLLKHCLKNYYQVLSGNLEPTEVLFPDGSFDLVEAVYCNNPIADYYNKIVAQIVKNYIKIFSKLKKINILEIGAGTGGTTRFVIPLIKDFDVNYTFSDVSYAFLKKAQKKFSDCNFINYKILDISSNKLIDEKFDIVIASNVIHATSDLKVTLNNIHKLMNDEGIFVLNEITSLQNFATVTFGLTDGWWLYQDNYRIENSPLVEGGNWRELLRKSNLFSMGVHGNDQQQIIVSTPSEKHSKNKIYYQSKVKPERKNSLLEHRKENRNLISESEFNIIKEYIKKVISDVMMTPFDEIEDDVPFQEYGIDSIISLELMKPLKDKYGYLPATLLFEHPTVNELSKHLLQLSKKDDINLTTSLVNNTFERKETYSSVDNEKNQPIENSNSSGIKQYVKKVISDVMMTPFDEIEDDVPFQEYGIDSIISLELMKPLKDEYGYLPATLLFEHPTVNELVGYLHKNFNITNSNSIQDDVQQPSIINLGNTDEQRNKRTIHSFLKDDIAIIGMTGQFPQAESLSEYAENLILGKDCSSVIPTSRWDKKDFIKKEFPFNGGSYTEVGSFIKDVYSFDNDFFNISPNESKKMDPQERLFLQNAFHLIQDAGYKLTDLKGSNTGVYVGVMNSTYHWHTRKNNTDPIPTALKWSISNRVSYFFDFHGPSMAIDSACSSSLSALHLACQALKTGDCDQAIVGGINLILHPRQYELLCGMYMLSKSGRSCPFGKGADGFVDGEGVGQIFLKSYKNAVKDDDRIYAVIIGSSLNSGGRANGYTAPNAKAQGDLIKRTFLRANIKPSEVSYVEAHGTGTELGDPIEVRGLSMAFADVENGTIPIGSVKSNIGHLESAAGMSSLIKVVLQMKKNIIFPSINAEEENKHLNLEQTPFYISKKVCQWNLKKDKIACVSSFGAGGSNANVVIKDYQKSIEANFSIEDDYYFITISHRNSFGLQMQLNALYNWLTKNYVDMYGLAYTLNCARDHFTCRRIFVVKSQNELLKLISLDLTDYHNKETVVNQQGMLSDIDTENLFIRNYKASEVIGKYLQEGNIPWDKLYPKKNILDLPKYQFVKNFMKIDSVESPSPDESEIIKDHNISKNQMAPASWVISKLYKEFAKRSIVNIKDLKWLMPILSFDDLKINVLDEQSGKANGLDKHFQFTTKDSKNVLCQGNLMISNNVELLEKFYMPFLDYVFIQKNEIYETFRQRGYLYGSSMQTLQWVKMSNKNNINNKGLQARSQCIKGFLGNTKDWGYSVSPALLDGGLQLAILLFEDRQLLSNNTSFVPFVLEECFVSSFDRNEAVYCYCILDNKKSTDYVITCDFYYTNSKNDVIAKFIGLQSVIFTKSHSVVENIINEKFIVKGNVQALHF